MNSLPTRGDSEGLPVSMVSQDPRLIPWRTAEENVTFALELKHPSMAWEERRQRALEAPLLSDRIVALAGQPTTVRAILPVTMARPRVLDSREAIEIRRSLTSFYGGGLV